MNIGFVINRKMLIGLGTTLSSLLRNTKFKDNLKFVFLISDLSENDIKNVQKLLLIEGYLNVSDFIVFDAKLLFGKFKSLHGDWTSYGRLLFADLTNYDSILYLDCDLIVNTDVFFLEDFNFNHTPLAVVNSGTFNYSLESKYFQDILELSPNSIYFNSGVLYFNLVKWRNENLKDYCLQFAFKHASKLITCDQTILNCLFNSNISLLPENFNLVWSYRKKKLKIENSIIHFVGSPKPWDPFARYFHSGYEYWNKYLHPFWKKNYSKFTLKQYIRMWHIKNSYLRHLSYFIFNR